MVGISEYKKSDLGTPNNFSEIIADDMSLVIYRPKLNAITGSVLSTILLQQIMYWSKKTGNDFYKFTAPCNHELYKTGDSWCEELGFSKAEFSTALKKIGFKLGKNKENNLMKKEDAFIIYYTDSKRLTHYSVNWVRVNYCLNQIYLVNQESEFTKENKESKFTKESAKTKLTKENSESKHIKENVETESTINSETTAEINSQTSTEKEASLSLSVDKFFNSIKSEMTDVSYKTFIEPLEFRQEGDKIQIISSSDFTKGMIKNKFIKLIEIHLKKYFEFEHIEVVVEEKIKEG